jgi:hypothetical protein
VPKFVNTLDYNVLIWFDFAYSCELCSLWSWCIKYGSYNSDKLIIDSFTHDSAIKARQRYCKGNESTYFRGDVKVKLVFVYFTEKHHIRAVEVLFKDEIFDRWLLDSSFEVQHISSNLLYPNWLPIVQNSNFWLVFRIFEKGVQRYLLLIFSNLRKTLVVIELRFFDVCDKLTRLTHLK